MNACFIDTSFVLAIALAQDGMHKHAVAWNRVAQPKRLITEYVLVEIADSLCQEALRGRASELIELIRQSAGVTVVASSPSLFQKGLDLFRSRPDKDWSLTDCLSFIVMGEAGLSDALSADHHFEQAGFRALLRLPLPAVDA